MSKSVESINTNIVRNHMGGIEIQRHDDDTFLVREDGSDFEWFISFGEAECIREALNRWHETGRLDGRKVLTRSEAERLYVDYVADNGYSSTDDMLNYFNDYGFIAASPFSVAGQIAKWICSLPEEL